MNSEENTKLKQYLADNYKDDAGIGEQLLDFITENNLKNIFTEIGSSLLVSMMGSAYIPPKSHSLSEAKKDEIAKDKLDFWIKQQMDENKSFQKKLSEFIKEHGYDGKHSKLYNKIFLDRRVFSRISSEAYGQQPEKKTVFKLIIGLELDLHDAEILLMSAGFNFNCHKRFDMFIKYCIENGIYETDIIDEYLVSFDEKTLFSIE